MRSVAFLGWLLVPLVAVAYHFGPGQTQWQLDQAADSVRQAEQLVEQQQFAQAVAAYERALALLPEDRTKSIREIRLERAKAQTQAAQLPAAREDLRDLVAELAADPQADEQLLGEARSTLANTLYYTTWLMRLEGQPKELWESEIESARQLYRLVAERAEQSGQTEARKHAEQDLEATVRLARLDLKELQGLPLPNQ